MTHVKSAFLKQSCKCDLAKSVREWCNENEEKVKYLVPPAGQRWCLVRGRHTNTPANCLYCFYLNSCQLKRGWYRDRLKLQYPAHMMQDALSLSVCADEGLHGGFFFHDDVWCFIVREFASLLWPVKQLEYSVWTTALLQMAHKTRSLIVIHGSWQSAHCRGL